MRRVVAALCLALSPLAADAAEVKAAVLRVERDRPIPISRLDLPPADEGFAGARLAAADNATSGRFLGHTYETFEASAKPEQAAAALDALAAQGARFVVTIAEADDLLALADRAAANPDIVLLNVSAPDDRLRGADCRANVLHITPSRRMLADGLAQYLLWKRWDEWVLVSGSHPRDVEKAEALRQAAKRFGAKIVSALVFEDTGGARRSDSGHVLVQKQIPVFMQPAKPHDVVVVADESEVFGAFIPYRTWAPRPVAGDAGLRATAWHAAHESYGATQLQNRFVKRAGRSMTDLDYEAWAALRAVGVRVTADRSKVFVALGPANRVAVIDGATLAVKDYLLVGQRVWQLAFTPDEKYLFTANGNSNDVSVIDVAAGKVVTSIPVGDLPWGVVVSPN